MKSSEIHSPRIDRLREELLRRHLDAALITDISNVFYLTGFTGSTAAVVVTGENACILVDPRYSIQARAECPGASVIDYTGKTTIQAAAELIADLSPARAGYESEHLTVSQFRELQSLLKGLTRLCATNRLVRALRSVKDSSEIEAIEQAARVTDAALQNALPRIKAGMTEAELALIIDTEMRAAGADKQGFDTIAASGPNSACPHAHPTTRVLKQGDFLVMDFGARCSGYHADITRTVCLGRPAPQQKEVYQIVLDAQLKALESIAPGKACRDIDAVARHHIASAGYADNFGHGLGHSIGIEVHEEPRFSQTCDAVLQPGMVMTVEPGIYIEGWGGVRIEDDVVITESGCRVITHSTKDLTAL